MGVERISPQAEKKITEAVCEANKVISALRDRDQVVLTPIARVNPAPISIYLIGLFLNQVARHALSAAELDVVETAIGAIKATLQDTEYGSMLAGAIEKRSG